MRNLFSISVDFIVNLVIRNTSEIKEAHIKNVQNSQLFVDLNKIDSKFIPLKFSSRRNC